MRLCKEMASLSHGKNGEAARLGVRCLEIWWQTGFLDSFSFLDPPSTHKNWFDVFDSIILIWLPIVYAYFLQTSFVRQSSMEQAGWRYNVSVGQGYFESVYNGSKFVLNMAKRLFCFHRS